MKKTVIIDYGAGNIKSVSLACAEIGAEASVTSDPDEVTASDRILFPGVGAAGQAVENLRRRGLDDAILGRIADGVPFFGICLGMQVLFDSSEEDGGVCTLGILPGTVRKFSPSDKTVKIPHMGWNQAWRRHDHFLLSGVRDGGEFYFVHSYHAVPGRESDILCETEYGGVNFTSMVVHENVAASQFHIEKSGKIGLRVLSNFFNWRV